MAEVKEESKVGNPYWKKKKEEREAKEALGMGKESPETQPAGEDTDKTVKRAVDNVVEFVGENESDIINTIRNAEVWNEKEWEARIHVLDDYTLADQINLFKLPDVCDDFQKKGVYRYRWLDKNTKETFYSQIDSSKPYHWILCNQSNAAYIPKHYFNYHGGVMKVDMLLSFMPGPMYTAWQAFKAKHASENQELHDDNTKKEVEGQGKFYKAEGSHLPGDVMGVTN